MTTQPRLSRRAFLFAILAVTQRWHARIKHVQEARDRAVAAYGPEGAATDGQLDALLTLSMDRRVGELGRRLAARCLSVGVSASRAGELVAHLRSRRGRSA